MALTNIKISMNEYKRLVEEDIRKAKSDSVYGKLLTSLSELTETMEKYFAENAEEKAPILSPKDYDNLIKVYSKVAKNCNEFLAEDRSKDRLESKRISIIKKLSSYVGKDLRGLLGADKTKKATLSDVVIASRTKTVDLTDKNLGHVGGALSSRIPLKSSSGIEGFFTKKVVFDYDESYQQVVKKLDKKLPEVFREGFANENNLERCLNSFAMGSGLDLNSPIEDEKEQAYELLATALKALNPSMIEKEIVAMLKGDPQFAASMLDIQQKYMYLLSQKYINEITGIKNNSRLDQRNSAMSDVAALFGMSNIIAKSIPMNIIHNGQVYEGTFMEKAKGEDIDKLSKDSLALQADEASFNHAKGLKQLADLQILDYICGNVDRHESNIMYQFKKNDEGKVVLDGICGIDNDASFGTELFETTDDPKEITPLPCIVNMSMSCYEAFQNISTDVLRVVLADKLSKEEIDAVCKRFDLLSKKLEEKKIHLVADNDWGKDGLTYDKISSDNKGISNTINNAIRIINRGKSKFDTLEETKTSLDYAEGKDVTNESEAKFKENFGKIEAFLVKAEKTKGAFHKDSVEYTKMLNALKEVKRIGKDINDKLEAKEKVRSDAFEDFAQMIVYLGQESQNYMGAKNLSQHTERGRDRFALARDMRDLALENFESKESSVKEPEMEDDNMEL